MDPSMDSTTWLPPYEHMATETIHPRLPPIQSIHLSIYATLFIVGVYVVVQRLDYYPLLPLTELLWNIFVYVLPPSFIMALDKEQPKAQTNMMGLSSYSSSRTFAAKSEAVRRILRMDGPIVSAGFGRSRTFSGIGSLMKGSSPLPIAGLGNWDNSCYQNSVIQGLASLPSIIDFLQHKGAGKTCGDGENSTRTALDDIIKQLNDPENAGKRLWTPAALKSMSSWQQQDAQEYYSKILDEVEKDIASDLKNTRTHEGLRMAKFLSQRESGQPSSKETELHPHHVKQITLQTAEKTVSEKYSEVFNPLEGLLAQRVGCLQCGYAEGLSMVPFNCLTLPLSKSFANSIENCLDEFTHLERIEGVECGKCTLLRQEQYLREFLQKERTPDLEPLFADTERRLEAVRRSLIEADFSENAIAKKCQIPGKQRVSSTKTKQVVVVRSPESLVLHINRSVFDETTGMLSKNTSHVSFPHILDLGCWSIGHSYGFDQEWSVDPHVSLLAGDQNKSETASLVPANDYILRAIITHYGRHENGHYICYRRDPDDSSKWWRLSDDNVSPVSQEEVLAQGGVFMLFYTRMPNTTQHKPPQVAISSSHQTNENARSFLVQEDEEEVASTIVSSSSPLDLKDDLKVSLSTPLQQDSESKLAERLRIPKESGEALVDTGAKDDKDLLSTELWSTVPLVPTMRTASITKRKARKGAGPGAGPGLSNMVAAN